MPCRWSICWHQTLRDYQILLCVESFPMAFQRKKREEIRIELTSMVDVVFLLLIFFMISTTFVDSQGVDIKLPSAQAEQVRTEAEEIKVYLEKSGRLVMDDQTISMAELKTHLSGYAAQRAVKTTFVLLADQDALHGQVVTLMDMARLAGFGKLVIATEPASD